MIQPKELISENILYSCTWEHRDTEYSLYLTKDKLYEYRYLKNEKGYMYSIYLVKDFGRLTTYPMSYRPLNYSDYAAHGFVNICSRHDVNCALASFDFPCSEEGAKIAEALFVAISKVIN